MENELTVRELFELQQKLQNTMFQVETPVASVEDFK